MTPLLVVLTWKHLNISLEKSVQQAKSHWGELSHMDFHLAK